MADRAQTPAKLILLLGCFSLVGYALRMNISVAAAFMMPELGLNKIQIGQLFTGFLLGYTCFQIPWGLMGDRFGARLVLTVAAFSWGVCTVLTGLTPGYIFSGGVLSFAALWLLRFLLGVGEAAGFPVAARAIASMMPSNRHAFAYAAVITGTNVGSAITPPLISRLMVTLGWRQSFYITSLLAFALALAWYFASAKSVTRVSREVHSTEIHEPWWKLLRNPAIGLLSLAYFLESYCLYVFIFWSYLYLVEQRHFTLLSGGIYTGLPFLLATFVVPLQGYLSDSLTERYGYKAGRRNLAIAGMLLSAVALICAVRFDNPYAAVVALSLSVAFQMSTENVFWSSAIELGGRHAGAAGGIMNTSGNLGGMVSTALVPVLIKYFGWPFAFGSASALAFLSAVVWLFIGRETKPALRE